MILSLTQGAMSWLRQLFASLSPWRPGFIPGLIHMGFVMNKVALRQVLLWVLQFSPVSIIAPWLCTLIYHLGYEQQACWWPRFRDIVSLYRHEQQCLSQPTPSYSMFPKGLSWALAAEVYLNIQIQSQQQREHNALQSQDKLVNAIQENIAVYSENHMKPTNTLLGKHGLML
jgi:hypothetical protein